MRASVGLRITSGVVAFFLLAASALAADQEIRNILAPSGKLKAALYVGTPTSILDADKAQPRGVGYEVGKALAAKLGVPYEPVVFSKNADVLEAVKTGKADVAFTNASPARQKEMDFGPTYLVIELGYLVGANSPIKSLAEVDQKDRRVGVTVHSTSESVLSHDLKNAEVVRAPTNGEGATMLAAGKVDAFATNKATLFELVDKAPGSHVLAERWGEERHAIGIPKGREQGITFIAQFTKEALKSGLVKGAMDRAGLKGASPAEP